MNLPFYSPVLGQIIEANTRATHPITGEVYGGTDWTNPEKQAEIGAAAFTVQEPPDGYVADDWEFAADEADPGTYIKRPASISVLPDPTQEDVDAMKETINVERARRLDTLKVSYDGVLYDADPISRTNIIALLVAIDTGMPVGETIPWRAADNVTRMLSLVTLKTIGTLVMYNVQVIYSASWYLKDTLLPSLTPAQFRAFDPTNDAYWQAP